MLLLHSIRNLPKVVSFMIETTVFRGRVIESIFSVTHNVHSVRATLILPSRIFKTGSIYDIVEHRIDSRI